MKSPLAGVCSRDIQCETGHLRYGILENKTAIPVSYTHLALQKGIPLSASFELSPLCNMNCRMCYVRLSKEEMKEKGRLRTAREWLELARQMRDAGTLFIICLLYTSRCV